MSVKYTTRGTIALECDCCGCRECIKYVRYREIKKAANLHGWHVKWIRNKPGVRNVRVVYCPLYKLIN